MDFVTVGRTGLRASVIGLGGGGPSRLGMRSGNTEAESVAVVRRALDLGVNFFDSAEAYGTEPILAKALAPGQREQVIISTKKNPYHQDQPVSAQEMISGVEASLRRLDTDYVDIFHVHGVHAHQYPHTIEVLVPALLRLKEQGKIRWLGITENFSSDTTHQTLRRALDDDIWDVMMVGFNMLNQSARTHIFPQTIAQNIGVLVMFAVRRALSDPERLRITMQELTASGDVPARSYDAQNPLGFLVHPGGAASITEAAYRYCRDEPGTHVVLSGTGNVDHLEENVRALLQSPLPPEDRNRVNELFAGIDTVSAS